MWEWEIFSKVRESSRNKRNSNYEKSKKILDWKSIKYQEKANWHLIIWDWNIWLTTWLFIHKKTWKKWRWIFNFLKKLEYENMKQKWDNRIS